MQMEIEKKDGVAIVISHTQKKDFNTNALIRDKEDIT